MTTVQVAPGVETIEHLDFAVEFVCESDQCEAGNPAAAWVAWCRYLCGHHFRVLICEPCRKRCIAYEEMVRQRWGRVGCLFGDVTPLPDRWITYTPIRP